MADEESNTFVQGGITVAFVDGRFVITGPNPIDAQLREDHLNAILDSEELARLSRMTSISQRVIIAKAIKLPADSTYKRRGMDAPTEKQIQFASDVGLYVPPGIGKFAMSFQLEKFIALKEALWEIVAEYGLNATEGDTTFRNRIARLAARLSSDQSLSMRTLLYKELAPDKDETEPWGHRRWFITPWSVKTKLRAELRESLQKELNELPNLQERISTNRQSPNRVGCMNVLMMVAIFWLCYQAVKSSGWH